MDVRVRCRVLAKNGAYLVVPRAVPNIACTGRGYATCVRSCRAQNAAPVMLAVGRLPYNSHKEKNIMSEFYKAVFEEYQKRLQGYKDELFPFTPLSFIQIRQLAMLAATVAEEIAAQPGHAPDAAIASADPK
jgi:hypothetical protein